MVSDLDNDSFACQEHEAPFDLSELTQHLGWNLCEGKVLSQTSYPRVEISLLREGQLLMAAVLATSDRVASSVLLTQPTKMLLGHRIDAPRSVTVVDSEGFWVMLLSDSPDGVFSGSPTLL